MEDPLYQTVAAEKQEEDEDPFRRLPDDLIISHIFDKIAETKSLCLISLVSKHFFSLAYQTKTVSLKIPLAFPDQESTLSRSIPQNFYMGEKVVHIIALPLRFVAGSSPAPTPVPSTDSSFMSHPTITFLGKFKSMTSLLVEFFCPGLGLGYSESEHQPVVRWKIDHKSATHILLMAHKNILDLAAETRMLRIRFYLSIACAIFSFLLMEKVVPSLPESLERVVITDSEKEGELCLGESDLVEMRRNVSPHTAKCEDASLAEMATVSSQLKILSLSLDENNQVHNGDEYWRVKDAFISENEAVAEAVAEMLKEVKAIL